MAPWAAVALTVLAVCSRFSPAFLFGVPSFAHTETAHIVETANKLECKSVPLSEYVRIANGTPNIREEIGVGRFLEADQSGGYPRWAPNSLIMLRRNAERLASISAFLTQMEHYTFVSLGFNRAFRRYDDVVSGGLSEIFQDDVNGPSGVNIVGIFVVDHARDINVGAQLPLGGFARKAELKETDTEQEQSKVGDWVSSEPPSKSKHMIFDREGVLAAGACWPEAVFCLGCLVAEGQPAPLGGR